MLKLKFLAKQLFVLAFLSGLYLPSHAGTITEIEYFDVSAFRGELVYLSFWRSSCLPCGDHFAWVNQLHRQYFDEGFRAIAINMDLEEDDAREFIREHRPRFDIVFDPKGSLATQYNVTKLPSGFLIDVNGEIIASHRSEQENERSLIESAIPAALPKF